MRKFNKSTICNIRHLVNVKNLSANEVGRKYKASRSTIRDIANYKTYKDIPAPKVDKSFPNYLVYPSGKVYSFSSDQFISPSRKSRTNNARYVNLRNGDMRKSFKINDLVSTLFS
jgi:hypothetical protein